MIRRREFIAGLGSAAAWPLAASAQQPDRMRRVGVLTNLALDDPETLRRMAAFVQGLQEFGWTEGRNMRFDYRSGLADADRYRRYAAELVALAPDVLLATNLVALGPLQQVTRTLPIVFAQATDPVGGGYVENLARPGGNATGFMSVEYSMSGKWPELLKQIAPSVTRVAVLRDPVLGSGTAQFAVIQAVAQSLGMQVIPVDMRSDRARLHCIRARVEWRPDRHVEHVGANSSRTDHHACGSPPPARGLSVPLFHYQRRFDRLRA
jgi:putative ABC transport system substrate-binding protein